MKRLACILLAWASPALAQLQPDEPAAVEPRLLDLSKSDDSFGPRDGATTVYQNIRPGDPGSLYFIGGGVHSALEFLSLERLDPSGRRVASPVKLGSIDLIVHAENPAVPFDVTVQFFEFFSEWRALSAGVAGGLLGTVTFRVDCGGAPCTMRHVDLGAIGGIPLPRGQCCISIVCTPVGGVPGPSGFPVFRSGAEHAGPDVGYSDDRFYSDQNNDGRFTASERLSFGGYPNVANLAVTLYGDDGCAIDYNGDHFVNGGDIDRIMEQIVNGCP